MCCSVLQYVVVCCSVQQQARCGQEHWHETARMMRLVCCSVLQCVAVCCSVMQYVAACCSLLQFTVENEVRAGTLARDCNHDTSVVLQCVVV